MKRGSYMKSSFEMDCLRQGIPVFDPMASFRTRSYAPYVLKMSTYVSVIGDVPLVRSVEEESPDRLLDPPVRSSDGVCAGVSGVRHLISNSGKEVNDAYW